MYIKKILRKYLIPPEDREGNEVSCTISESKYVSDVLEYWAPILVDQNLENCKEGDRDDQV